MHKRNNKPSRLLNLALTHRLHKAPRFVQSFAIEQVFNDTARRCKGSSALIVIYKTGLTTRLMQRIAKNTAQPATVFLNQANIKKIDALFVGLITAMRSAAVVMGHSPLHCF